MKSEQKRVRLFNANHWFYVVLVCFWAFHSAAFAENSVEAERQNWEVYTSRKDVLTLLLSDDGNTLWVGTEGGLEERYSSTGELKKIYLNQSGLPNNYVMALLSDGQSGLWIGTDGGIAHLKSNGLLEIFNTDNSKLPDNSVTSLLSDCKGGLWVGTSYGLAHLKADGKWEIFNTDNSKLPDNYITELLSDGKGGLWIGTYGLAHLKADGKWEVFNKDNSALQENWLIESVFLDDQDELWVGAYHGYSGNGGLAHLKIDGTWEIFDQENSALSDNYVRSVISDGQSGLWIGTYRGIDHLKIDGTWEIFDQENSALPDNYTTHLISDGQNGLWVGTIGGGLAHLRADGTWKIFYKDYVSMLPFNCVTSLLSDGQSGLWVGNTHYSIDGVDFAHWRADGTWQFFNDANNPLLDSIYALESDNQGGIWGWGGDWNVLFHLRADGTLKVFNDQNSDLPPGIRVISILSDNQDGIWLGTTVNGLVHMNADGTCHLFDTKNSDLPNNYVDYIVYDGESGLWMATAGAILANLKEDGTWDVLYCDEIGNSESPTNLISSIISDRQGGLWVGTVEGDIAHLKEDDTWEIFNVDNTISPFYWVFSLLLDGRRGLWVGTFGGLAHLKEDGAWDIFTTDNSNLPDHSVKALLSDDKGGLWIGTDSSGLAHLLLFGTPEQLIKPNSPEITINWFLNSSPLDYQNVKYIELQRSLSQDGVYETVLDESDNPVRFYADYSICPKPRVDGCWVAVEGHTPETRTNSDGSTTKGYTLNTPINDPEWLEGLPRYYRLSAVIEEDGKLIRVANNSEAALITPQVEEKPRVELTLDKNAIAMQANQKAEITVFVSSLDLFRGDVTLEVESGEGIAISDNTNTANGKIVETHDRASLRSVSLKAGETKPVLLTIDAFAENTQTIKIIPKIQSGYSGKSTSLNVQIGDDTNSMIALSIAHKTKRTRVLDSLTIAGNVIPAQRGQKVVISGNNIKKSAESANSNESLTLTTDENGYFQGSVTPIHAGTLTLTAKSNGITSNTAEIFILPARTNIALSSNVNQSTKKGDILRVQGIITPVRLDGTKVNLDIRYLDPANQSAGLQPQFVGGVEIDANGVFYRDVVVPDDGFINVKASLPETSDYLSINTKLVIPIGQPVGEGIIVVAESGNADFQTISKSLGSYVYQALKSRNIPAERIEYLGIADDLKLTNGTANKTNLHDALTNWATSLFSTDDPYKTPLNLYLIGKVEDGSFRLNDSEVLTADDLAQYLNEAEEIIKTNSKDNYSEYKGFPVTIVLEGTQSGKWIEKIAGNGRIILTSSSDEAVDAGGFAGYDNIGESSFSRYFYEFINYGSDIEGSFAEANYEILKFYRHTQRPVMDADGDGVGTTNFDRYEASGKFIEYRPSGNLRPQIRTTNPDLTINRGDLENNFLWAIATDPENEMQGVFCSITDPSNKTVNIEMKLDTGNVYKTDLKQNYPNLSTGCYQAVYYAKDKAGNVSLPEQKFLNVISSSGVLLEAPQMKITTKGNMVTVSWSEVANAYGYRLFYAPYPTPNPSDIGEIDMGNQRTITFDGKGFAFYGAVKAYNSNGLSGLSNIEFFDLR